MEIISRSEAKRRGLKRYFTGVPCEHGHVAERRIGGVCIDCGREHLRRKRREIRAALGIPDKANCLICGIEFSAYGRQKMCSEVCSAEYRYLRNKNYHQTVLKKCVICNEKFKPHGKQVACSKECMKLNRKAKNRDRVTPNRYRFCGVCGEIFSIAAHKAKFCSYECQSKAKLIRTNNWRQRIVFLHSCIECGVQFFGTHGQKTCSAHCRHLARQQKIPRKCEECGKDFIGITAVQKTCSPKCSYERAQKKRRSQNLHLRALEAQGVNTGVMP